LPFTHSSTVTHVKQNLEVAESKREAQSEALKKAEKVAKLKAKKEALQTQIIATREAIDKLHTQTRRNHIDIASSECDKLDLQRKIEEHDIKMVILETYEKHISRMQNVLNEYHTRLTAKISLLQSIHHNHNATTTLHTEQEPKIDENNDSKRITELYEDVCSHLESTASSFRLGQQNHVDMDAAMMALPSEVEEKLADLCSRPTTLSILMSRLSTISKDETDHLETVTEKLDLSAMETMALERLETESLGQTSHFGFSSSASTSPRATLKSNALTGSPRIKRSTKSAFPTVEELLEQQQQEHVSRYLSTEKSLNAAHVLGKQRDQMLEASGRSDSLFGNLAEISANFPENLDPNASFSQLPSGAKLNLQHKLQNLELVFCSDEAAYETSCIIVERLTETKKRFERDLRTLKEKFQRIQELDSENKERQVLCQELLRINTSTKDVFEAQNLALHSFLSTKLVDRQRELQAAAKLTENNDEQLTLNGTLMMREVTAFHQYSMISATKTEKELSSPLAQLVMALELKAHQSLDGIVTAVSRGLLEMDKVTNLQKARKLEIDSTLASFAQWNDNTAVKALEEQVMQLEKTQTDVWLPYLESSMSQISKATDHCASIQQLCSDFVKQPAQHFVPWLKLGGHTFEETLKSWKSYCHTLRQQKQ
jgi:hypothetical protein